MTSLINNLGGAVGFGEFSLDRNDDSSAQGISLSAVFGDAGLNFFGTNYSYVAINNNGNITLSNSSTGGLTAYTPFGLANGGYAIIAPFFADVDTRLIDGTAASNQVTPTAGGTSTGSDLVWYDLDPTGYGTLTVTWDDVGYFDWNTDKLNAFQLQIIGRGGGNFDIVFRYEDINWTTGDFSGGYSGLGGTVARAGFSTGDGQSWYELAQSGFQDAMLALESTPGNTGVSGYYTFSVSSGTVASDSLMGGGGDDLLSGAEGDDTIYGFGGNDYLIGNAGADTLVGGGGNDTYTVDEFDTVVEGENEGIDSLLSGVAYTLGANLENLRLTGSDPVAGAGNTLSNVLAGNAADNTLNGMEGNDTADYSLATSGITVELASALPQYNDGQGYDTLISIENVIGSIYGDSLSGTSGANILNGNLGADTMTGGAGNDTYLVDHIDDIVTELSGQGIDTVRSAITYTLTANVERLTLTGTDAIDGTGNGSNNILTGNSAANMLNGLAGNDRYVVNNIGDIVTELAGQGTDTVQSSVTFTLSANVERLTLTGTKAINGTGNGSNNILTGNNAANKLSGLSGNDRLIGNGGNDTLNGGSGKDNMKGGTGNDTYVVDNIGDIVTELSGQGTDTVQSSVTFTLSANVERLTLTGTKAINGTGNASNNILTGNNAANNLNGLTGNDTLIGNGGNDTLSGEAGKDVLAGGLGNDVLMGGLGSDFFVFNTALGATNIDTIKDYTAAADTIRLENSIFTKLAATGALGTANFKVGAAAADANDFIVYNNSTGALYYDADGSGAGAAIQFATAYVSGTTPATLSAAEFVVI